MSTHRSRLRTSTAVQSFAHLLGLQRPAAAEPTEDERTTGDDETARAAEGDEKDCPECEGSGETNGGEDCEACGGTGKVSVKRGKKARKAETDETCEEEDSDDEGMARAARAGRAFERARCAAIFASPQAAGRPDLAAHMAFNTRLSAQASIDMIAATTAGGVARPARAARPRVDGLAHGGAPQSGAQSVAAQIVAAGKKRRGEA